MSIKAINSVIKHEYEGDWLVKRHDTTDFNTGSQLIVLAGQEAVFLRAGKVIGTFPAGKYTLDTDRIPFLGSIIELVAGARRFHSEVYFFNLTHQMGIRWGTAEKVNFLEPTTGAPMSLGARGILNFRISNPEKMLIKLVSVGQTKLLLSDKEPKDSLLGTHEELDPEIERYFQNYFRTVIQVTVSSCLANIITEEKLDILQLDQQKQRLSAAILPHLQACFNEYGLEITEFLLVGIALPEKDELGHDTLETLRKIRGTELQLAELDADKQVDTAKHENALLNKHHELELTKLQEQQKLELEKSKEQQNLELERLKMQLEMERKAQTARIEAEEMRLKGYNQKDVMHTEVQVAYANALGQMGANGGGAGLGDVAGLGMTLGAMGGVMNMTKEAMAPLMNMNTEPAASTPVTIGWDCSCGSRNIQSKFCPDCGSQKPEPAATWDCQACGNKGITGKFCGECGAKKPEITTWDCPNCGNQGVAGNFCSECGTKKPDTTT